MSEGEIRIYVACLAAYNSGILHGRWIDAEQEPDAIRDGIGLMLKASPIPEAEEWAIHAYEGFEGVSIAESEDIEQVSEFARFVAEHGKLGAKLIDHFGNIEQAREALEERYRGCFESLADYVQELTEGCTSIPEHLRFYIDWQAMARDAELNGEVLTIETAFDAVHVFSS